MGGFRGIILLVWAFVGACVEPFANYLGCVESVHAVVLWLERLGTLLYFALLYSASGLHLFLIHHRYEAMRAPYTRTAFSNWSTRTRSS